MELKDKIRVERENRRLTRAELGKFLGVSGMTVGRWERGTIPEPEHLRRLSELLNRPIEALLDTNKISPEAKRMRRLTKALEQVARLHERGGETHQWTALETLLDLVELWTEEDWQNVDARRIEWKRHAEARGSERANSPALLSDLGARRTMERP